jgi:DNA invertase Pin-like site-specific DNA recombinase
MIEMTKAIYIRTSTQEQTPELQLDSVTKMFDGEYIIYKDQQSAWKDNVIRESFEKLKLSIQRRKVKDIYVWDLDRLFRNRKKLLSFFEYCRIYNCQIHSYRQQWLQDINKMPEPFNEMMHGLMLQIMGWIAQEESEKKSARIKNAVSKREGKTMSKYGNTWGRKTISTFKKNLIIKYRDQDMPMRAIANEVKVSLGVVHKTLREFNEKNPPSQAIK